jgi:predicted nuclease of predicted toxin-antitoxin system
LKIDSPKFLADESCDFSVVRLLRSLGYDVTAIVETTPSSLDLNVLHAAINEKRILITEDKDFGEWIYSHGEQLFGVIFIRFPANIRQLLNQSIGELLSSHSKDLIGSFTVVEPGKVRIRHR